MREPIKLSAADHVRGPDDAGLVLVQYGDYTLRDCQEAQGAVSHLLSGFGRYIKFVYRHFVHERVNHAGFVAAKAAEAAAQQEKFWEIHSRFMEAKEPLTSADIVRHARDAGLDTEQFLKDVASDRSSHKIKSDLASGAILGVCNVPAFFLNGEQLPDPFSNEQLVQAVAKALLPD